jgi:hypothetical protein
MQIGLSLKTTCAVIFSPLLLQGEEFFLSVRAYSAALITFDIAIMSA